MTISKKIKILLLIVFMSLTLCLMNNTYSRYVADTTGNLEILFAKWQILINDYDITNQTTSTITLSPVIEENENVASNTLAPSSKGYFDIDVDPTNVGVSFEYLITLNVLNENIPDLMITKYSILDNDYTEGDTLEILTISDNVIQGTLNYDNTTENFSFQPFTIRIYFEWYEGEDEQMDDEDDTEIANDAITNNTTLQIEAKIEFKQKI